MAITGPGRRKSVTVVPMTGTPLLDAFKFDLTRSMSINYSTTPTTHPVQNGAEGLTDFIVVNPPEVSVSGVTANTPVDSLAALSPFFSVQNAGVDRMGTLVDLIIKMNRLGILTIVFCSWHKPLISYHPSVVGLTRDQSSGNTIPVTVSFKRIRIVNTLTLPAVQDSDILALAQSRLEFGPVAFE